MHNFIKFANRYYDDMIEYVLQHLVLSFSAVLISILIAFPISLLLLKSRKCADAIVALMGCVYSIPSMALFAILMPLFGLGMKTAIITLTLYCQFILIRNFIAGFDAVSPVLIETGVAMGLTPFQVFYKIKLPQALPTMIAGVRLALISTIASAVIAQTINAGGIGVLIFRGLRTLNIASMLWGTILSACLALICNYFFEFLERKSMQYANGYEK